MLEEFKSIDFENILPQEMHDYVRFVLADEISFYQFNSTGVFNDVLISFSNLNLQGKVCIFRGIEI